MTRKEIMGAIKSLAHSQGYYGDSMKNSRTTMKPLNFLKSRISKTHWKWSCFWKTSL